MGRNLGGSFGPEGFKGRLLVLSEGASPEVAVGLLQGYEELSRPKVHKSKHRTCQGSLLRVVLIDVLVWSPSFLLFMVSCS